MNEELQSTNEELETSKEELQSFNEELHSVNSQLQHKIGELDQTGNDLANLLSGTEIATLFLDTEMRIKWFSPATRHLLDLEISDIGRPIRHFARKFSDDRLLEDAGHVLARLTPMEAEVHSDEGKWFLRRILPYRTQDNRISGLVITFVDITDRKTASDAIDQARVFAEAIVTTARQPLVVLDRQLRVRSANRAFYLLFDTAPDRAVSRQLGEGSDSASEWSNPELLQLLHDVVVRDQQFEGVELAFGTGGRNQKTLLLNARKLKDNGNREELILLAIEDVTAAKHAARHQEMLIGELNHRVKNVLATVQAVLAQTLRQSGSLGDFTKAFSGRLHALAQAHDLLAAEEWIGTEIAQVVSRTLAPYQTQGRSRVVAEGPPLTVPPHVGVALVMIFHELATNAAKYGALSVPVGRVAVAWNRESDPAGDRIRLEWREAGGPKVRPPTAQGFGTKLIERSAAHELGGEARLEYLGDGLRCELIFPWAEASN